MTTYKKGDQIHIKPEWQDDGEDKYDWFVAEDQHPGADYVKAVAIDKETGDAGIGWMEISIKHLVP